MKIGTIRCFINIPFRALCLPNYYYGPRIHENKYSKVRVVSESSITAARARHESAITSMLYTEKN